MSRKKILLLISVIITIVIVAGFLIVILRYPGLIPSDKMTESQQYFFERHGEPALTNPNFQIEVYSTGLDFPTKMTFVHDVILVSQKNDGVVRIIKDGIILNDPALDLNVESFGERGLVGLSSGISNNKDYVFVYFTESSKKEDTFSSWLSLNYKINEGTKLFRYSWNGQSLIEPIFIFRPIVSSSSLHQGGAMTFYNNTLFIGVGDNDEPSYITNHPQEEPESKTGAIFAFDQNGNPSILNPFFDNDILNTYYAYGIRNIYGLAVDPLTNNLWDTENGPSEFDEINLIFPGFNSGWNKIMGPNGRGNFSANVSELTQLENAEYSDPEFSWRPTVAPTAIEFFNSNQFGDEYWNDVFVGDVMGNLYHFELNDDRTQFVFSNPSLEDMVADNLEEMKEIIFAKNLGLITDIKVGPDGYLYVLSLIFDQDEPGWKIIREQIMQNNPEIGSNKGVIFRIVPTNSP